MFGFNYKTYLFLFLCGLVGTLLLTPLVRRLALRLQLVDDPGVRKIHERAVPTLGGLSIFITFVLLVVSCLFYRNRVTDQFLENGKQVFGILACGLAALLLGVYDDTRGADAKKKFSVQIAVAILAFALGFRIVDMSLKPLGDIDLGVFSLPITILWIVGITNAINMIDGLDGLAAGVTLFVCIGNFLASLVLGNVVMAVISAILAGALVGFLRYNFPPAKIFLGDTGSLFLGIVISLTSLASAQKSSTVVMLLIPIVALGLPILDTSLAIFRRSLLGRPVFASDNGHIHHVLLRLGLGRKRAVLILYAFCIFLLGFVTLVLLNKSTEAAIYLGAIGLLSVIGMRVLGYLNYGNMRAALSNRWRYRIKDIYSRLTLLKIKKVESVSELWKLLTEAAEELGLGTLELSLNAGDEHKVLRWAHKEGRQEKRDASRDELSLRRFNFSGGLGYLVAGYKRSQDEDLEFGRNDRLEVILRAAERRLAQILKLAVRQS